MAPRTPYRASPYDRFPSLGFAHFACAALVLMLAGPASASDVEEFTKIEFADAEASDRLGSSISIDGDRMAVGAIGGSAGGSVHVFERIAGVWTEVQEFQASDAAADDQFGSSVGLHGDVIVVGAPFARSFQGAAYVFRYDGTQWVEEQILIEPAGVSTELYAVSTTVHGDTVMVGARSGGVGGAVFVYGYDGSTWVEQQQLEALDSVSGDSFGDPVVLDGGRAMMGARGADPAGAAYVFEFDGSSWTQAQKLTPSDGEEFDSFGASVALDGTTAMIGASGVDLGTGAVYRFEFDGSSWSQAEILTASDGVGLDRFGDEVALEGDSMFVGAFGVSSRTGAVYRWEREGGVWTEKQKLVASDGMTNESLGRDLALQGDLLFAGVADVNTQRGAVYGFRVPCESGSINDALGSGYNVLAIDGSSGGSDRTVQLSDGDFVPVTLVRPGGGGSGRFVLHANLGAPSAASRSTLPFDVGTACFPFLLGQGASPLIVANNVGRASAVGTSQFLGNPFADPESATITFFYPDLPAGWTYTFQAIIADPGARSSKGFSLSNAVLVEVLP